MKYCPKDLAISSSKIRISANYMKRLGVMAWMSMVIDEKAEGLGYVKTNSGEVSTL